jgi:hypothetical protein
MSREEWHDTYDILYELLSESNGDFTMSKDWESKKYSEYKYLYEKVTRGMKCMDSYTFGMIKNTADSTLDLIKDS